ncbi:hypothetical protein pdam_00007195 [Pocillopora damicornis]|uniref:SCP domain-containing protein n=1 Tax=Pocillopora damicornis TaxID=46731 RepID=A0A3M6US95_POCDA|nr:hypothetical protein pdam_00007195 [Pocillopora damicornis]
MLNKEFWDHLALFPKLKGETVLNSSIFISRSSTPSFKEQCLKWHNAYRELHQRREIVQTNYKSPDYAYSPPQQVQNVTWNDTLAANAENWANYLATNNLFEHAKNIWEGENLYLSGSPLPTEPCTEATQLFYREIDNYDFSKPGFSLKTGHFTQVFFHNFFNATDSLFVIHVEVTPKRIRNDSRLVVVIRYFPPGNLISGKEAFKKNVLPIPERERGGAIERRASLALTGFVFIVGTCCQFLF